MMSGDMKNNHTPTTEEDSEEELEKQLKELELKAKEKRKEIAKRKLETEKHKLKGLEDELESILLNKKTNEDNNLDEEGVIKLKESLHFVADQDVHEEFPLLDWGNVIPPATGPFEMCVGGGEIGSDGGDSDTQHEQLLLALEEALKNWRPSGNLLINLLRNSASQLDANQMKTNVAGVAGGAVSLIGVPLTIFPLTAPVGAAVCLAGAAVGLGASGVNYLAKKPIENFVNGMMKEHESGYTALLEAFEEYKKYILEKPTDDKLFEEFEQKWSSEIKPPKDVDNDDKTDGIRNVGKAATAAQNAERLSRVAPLLKYIGMSNRATRAAMVKDAITAAKLAKKATGATGAAAKAMRADNIRKATGAFKVARDGAKVGARGVGMAAFGAVFALIDITLNVKDLANGSIAAQSKVYREMADQMEELIKTVLELIED